MQNPLIQKVQYFLERLSSKPLVAGLQITDTAVQYIVFGAGEVHPLLVKIPAGILRDGRVMDREKLLQIFLQLHNAISEDAKKIIPVSLVLPVSGVYTQSFTVPNIGWDKLEESANLNIQMISPMPPEKSYMSWQVVQETPDQFELLGAFTERTFVDDIRMALEEAHFSPIALEFPSLAITRLIAFAGSAGERPALLFQISGDGLNISIIKNKGLYFDYFRSWRSIQGDKKEITKEYFESVVAEEVQRVINFALSKFKENPERVFLVVPGFEEGMKTFIQQRFSIPAILLQFSTWPISPQWYAAAGAALRESAGKKFGEPISFLSNAAGNFFLREQILNFVRLWRGIVFSVLGILFVLFSGSAYVLSSELQTTRNHVAVFTANLPKGELQALESKVRIFNALVANAALAEKEKKPYPLLISRIRTITDARSVVIDRLDTGGSGGLITLFAHTGENQKVTEFKNFLSREKDFKNVDLKLTQVTTREDGTVGFQIDFSFVPLSH